MASAATFKGGQFKHEDVSFNVVELNAWLEPIRLPAVDEFKRRALTNSSGSTVLEPARAILDATGTGELREFAPMPPPGRPSPPGRPRSREHSFAD